MSNVETTYYEKIIDTFKIGVLSILLKKENKQIISLPSQIGCNNECVFCISKDAKLIRNLSDNELFDLLNLAINDNYEIDLCFTGEGEPIHNIKNINKLFKKIEDNNKIKNVKISFSGLGSNVLSKIETKKDLTIQFSLHHANNEKRKLIIPKTDNLKKIKENILKNNNKFKSVNINYVLIDGFNDKQEDLIELENFMNNTNWNLIFNPKLEESSMSYKKIEVKYNKVFFYKNIAESITKNNLYKNFSYQKQNEIN